ncbi:MAG: hypothetical protein LBH26_07835 [Treponema sp.]|jgi:hypothetical protein|nr:hypothetical protein [Treponema sp.]
MKRTKPLRAAAFVLLLFSSAALALGLGGREKKREAPGAEGNGAPPPARDTETRIRISGRVRLVGGGPFPRMVISGEGREWYIDQEEESKLLDFQQRLVTVEGTESYTDLSYANGLPAGRLYTLRDIELSGER